MLMGKIDKRLREALPGIHALHNANGAMQSFILETISNRAGYAG
jgi:hypothetical protein